MCFWWKKKPVALEVESESTPEEDTESSNNERVEIVEAEPEYYLYSQKDPRWGSLKIGKTNYTLASHGCLVTSLAMLLKKPPYEVLQALNAGNGFTDKTHPKGAGLLDWDKAQRILKFGHTYLSARNKTVEKPCIAETNHYAPGNPQHFFVWLGGDKILDPLNYPVIERKNNYYVVSFRIIET